MEFKKQKYCILKGIEGFGDRLQCLLQAIQYCEHTNRTLVIDWRDSNWQQDDLDCIENYFSIKNIKTESINTFLEKHRDSTDITPIAWVNKIETNKYQKFIYNKSFSQKENSYYHSIINQKMKDFKEEVVVYAGIGFRTFYFRYFEYLNFSEQVKKVVENKLTLNKLQPFEYNCIHIRYKNKHWIDSFVANKNLVNRIQKRFKNKTEYFDFLFTQYKHLKNSQQKEKTIILSDDFEAANNFNQKYFGGKLINLAQQNISTSGLCGIHKKIFNDKYQKKQINIDALADFNLMLKSSCIINDKISLYSNMAMRVKRINDRS